MIRKLFIGILEGMINRLEQFIEFMSKHSSEVGIVILLIILANIFCMIRLIAQSLF